MKVHEIMTAHARCVGPENTLVEAAGLMRELDVGALPVCEEDRLVGIVTDRDLALRGIANGKDPNTATIGEVMTAGVVHVFADQSVEEVARLMETRQIRRVPVLNRGKRLVGIVSLGDIAISSNPAFSGLALRDVSEPRMPTARQRRLAERSRPSQMMPRVPGAPGAPAGEGAGRNGASRTSRRRATSTRKKSARTSSGGQRTRKRSSGSTTRSTRKRGSTRTRAAAAAGGASE
jgi:CBS domain-containing protein